MSLTINSYKVTHCKDTYEDKEIIKRCHFLLLCLFILMRIYNSFLSKYINQISVISYLVEGI